MDFGSVAGQWSNNICVLATSTLAATEGVNDIVTSITAVCKINKMAGHLAMMALIVTPLGKPLGYDGMRLPIHAFCPLVKTLRNSHQLGLFHIDVCGDNMLALREEALPVSDNSCRGSISKFRTVLNDWVSSMPTTEAEAAEMIFTRQLYYDLSHKKGPGCAGAGSCCFYPDPVHLLAGGNRNCS